MIIEIVEDNQVTQEQKDKHALAMRCINAMKVNGIEVDFTKALEINSMGQKDLDALAVHLGIK